MNVRWKTDISIFPKQSEAFCQCSAESCLRLRKSACINFEIYFNYFPRGVNGEGKAQAIFSVFFKTSRAWLSSASPSSSCQDLKPVSRLHLFRFAVFIEADDYNGWSGDWKIRKAFQITLKLAKQVQRDVAKTF